MAKAAPFYAVIFKSQTTIPGDERSRTNPGHGYPEHTVEHNEFLEFPNEGELRDWIMQEERRAFYKREYRVLLCTPIAVETEIQLKFK